VPMSLERNDIARCTCMCHVL